ncbi:hypothetical protein TrCOL_g2888 [Triparma columacea]|uniref:Uncharacterized protein n=1 Tax=Triparma columacea TaxID=722753 RepID=A0A9W7LA24_9STRA|nr:hypothetical protein TrCOL_g2888 [Triparma columacea]
MSTEYPLSASMSTNEAIFFVFTQFASFGRKGLYKQTAPEMDNSSFAKLLKSLPNLIDSGITRPDIDLIFNYVKHKNDRKLNFSQFLNALQKLSEKKYPMDDPITAFSRLCAYHLFAVLENQEKNASASTMSRVTQALLGTEYVATKTTGEPGAGLKVKGKVFAGTKNKAGGIFEKLTDKTLYTGVYKNLDGTSDGRINGYDGDVSGNIRDLSSMMRPSMRVNTKFIDV